MIGDRIRMDAYAQALRNAMKPGAVVLDIGTGPGVFAMLACQLGAGRVFAIEADPVIQIAREVAQQNGYADKIEFYESFSTDLTLPAQADIMISDLRGILPLFERHIVTIADARCRFLAPSGTLIPCRDVLQAALASAPQSYGAVVDPWEQDCFGQDFGPARRRAVNTPRKTRLTSEQLLTKPQTLAILDYAVIESPDIAAQLNWTVERAGTGHGIVVWFDAELAEGIGFSNAPGSYESIHGIYGSLFFPWIQPVSLAHGDTVSVNFTAKLMNEDYGWRWDTRVEKTIGAPVEFRQSSLQGAVLSPGKLSLGASDYLPRLSEEGLLDRRILELMNGRANLEEIARKLVSDFPSRFTGWQDALSFAAALSRRYSR